MAYCWNQKSDARRRNKEFETTNGVCFLPSKVILVRCTSEEVSEIVFEAVSATSKVRCEGLFYEWALLLCQLHLSSCFLLYVCVDWLYEYFIKSKSFRWKKLHLLLHSNSHLHWMLLWNELWKNIPDTWTVRQLLLLWSGNEIDNLVISRTGIVFATNINMLFDEWVAIQTRIWKKRKVSLNVEFREFTNEINLGLY